MLKEDYIFITISPTRRSGIEGQIVTLFIVVLAAIFLMVAITMHLGRSSIRKTRLSFAADQGALMLASHLASFANLLSTKHLGGGRGGCHFSWTNFWKIMLTIIMIIVAIVVSVVTISCTWYIWVGLILMWIGTIFNIVGTALYFTKTMPGIASQISRSLKQLGREMQFEETIKNNVFLTTIDDPVQVIDVFDYDEDLLTNDTIPRFHFWNLTRLKIMAMGYQFQLSSINNQLRLPGVIIFDLLVSYFATVTAVRAMLRGITVSASNGYLRNPLSYILLAMPTQLIEDWLRGETGRMRSMYGSCFPQEVVDWFNNGANLGDLPTIDWQPGQLNVMLDCFAGVYSEYLPTWLIGGFPNQPPVVSEEDFEPFDTEFIPPEILSTGYTLIINAFYNDKIDRLIYDLDNFIEWATVMSNQVATDAHTFIDTVDMWLPMLYSDDTDPEASDWYHVFQRDIVKIGEIMFVLPGLAFFEFIVGNVAGADGILVLITQLGQVAAFYAASMIAFRATYTALSGLLGFFPTDDKYVWHDSLGWHYINVYVSDFKIPYIKPSTKGAGMVRCEKLRKERGVVGVGVSRRDAPGDMPMETFINLIDPLGFLEDINITPRTIVPPVFNVQDATVYMGRSFVREQTRNNSAVYDYRRPFWKFADTADGVMSSVARAQYNYKNAHDIRLICTDKDGIKCAYGCFDPSWSGSRDHSVCN